MGRSLREFKPGFCYHITTRCNNREFKLIRHECRQVFLYALNRVKAKFACRLYGLCIMSNHVHYLLEPQQPEDLPRIMHWLNWYTAMCFNRMLNRTGHFWEARYYAGGFPSSDHPRVLNLTFPVKSKIQQCKLLDQLSGKALTYNCLYRRK